MIRVALVLVVCARIARADARLEESGACEGVRERVLALVGRDPFTAVAATTIAVTTEASPSGASGSLSIAVAGRPAGHRALAAASCAVLVDDLALAIAVVLASPPEAEPPTRDAAVEVPPDMPAIDLTRDADTASAWQLAMLGGAATSWGGTTAAVVGLRVKRGALSLTAGLALDSADELSVAPGTVTVSRSELSLLPCLHVGRAAACGDVAAGWISGNTSGFASSATATMPFAALGLRLVWEQPLVDWLAVQGFVEGRVALTSNRFLIDDMAVWTGARVEAWFGIAAVAHIP